MNIENCKKTQPQKNNMTMVSMNINTKDHQWIKKNGYSLTRITREAIKTLQKKQNEKKK